MPLGFTQEKEKVCFVFVKVFLRFEEINTSEAQRKSYAAHGELQDIGGLAQFTLPAARHSAVFIIDYFLIVHNFYFIDSYSFTFS